MVWFANVLMDTIISTQSSHVSSAILPLMAAQTVLILHVLTALIFMFSTAPQNVNAFQEHTTI